MLDDFINFMQMQPGMLKVDSLTINSEIMDTPQDKLESYLQVLRPRRLVIAKAYEFRLSIDITQYGVKELIIKKFYRINWENKTKFKNPLTNFEIQSVINQEKINLFDLFDEAEYFSFKVKIYGIVTW